MSDFRNELHRVLAERGISLSAAARQAGCSKGYLSNAANGRKPLTPRVAASLDRLFGTGDTFAAYALLPSSDSIRPGTANARHSTHRDAVTTRSVRMSGSRADIRSLLRTMSDASAVPVIAALREVHRGYLSADQLTGGLSVLHAARTQIPVVEKASEVTRGADRSEALDFACRFMEFCGWLHQDAGDLTSAMFCTDRAFDHALELGDQRTIAYTLMRKSAIATEAGNPGQGLGIANFALLQADALTPRIRAVILRQRAHALAALQEATEAERSADDALAEAIAGTSQGEEDRAPYCSPMYVAMESGQSMAVAGRPGDALAVLVRSHLGWSDHTQVRDHALCVSCLAAAYAAAGHPEEACSTAEEAMSLAHGIGSRRVISQLEVLLGLLGRWKNDPIVVPMQRKLSELVGSFQPG
jgi:tetratricopeptide (TPR) repeat protein/transcriptional regulator with XRE-family HTH domain